MNRITEEEIEAERVKDILLSVPGRNEADIVVAVRVSPTEAKILRAKAKLAGLSQPNYVRRVMGFPVRRKRQARIASESSAS